MQKKKKTLLLLIVPVFIIFFQVIFFDFLNYDDNLHILHKTRFLKKYSFFLEKPHDFALVYTAWAVQAIFARSANPENNDIQLNPRIYHAFNFIFHINCAIIVFLILKLIIKNQGASLIGALVFAIHPVQVESVAWVTGLKDILSGFFSFLAIWFYIKYTKKENLYSFYYGIATVSFILAMMAKTTTVVLPIIIFFIDYFLLKRPWRKIIKPVVLWVILAIPMMIITKLAQPDNPLVFIPNLAQRVLVAGDTITYYLYKLIFPFSMGPDYGRSPAFILKGKIIYFTFILTAGLVIILWTNRKKFPWLSGSAGIFIAGILTVLGIIPFHFQRISTPADRYLYIAMLGPALAAAWLFSRYKKKKLVKGTFIVLLSIFGVSSFVHARFWKNNMVFYHHALKINPESWLAHNNLASIYEEKKDHVKAIEHYSKAIELHPAYADAYYNLGIVLEKTGNLNEAYRYYSEAIKIQPNYDKAYYNRGIVLEKQHKYNEAIASYSNTIKINPSHVKAYINIGTICEKKGEFQKAVNHYLKALQINPQMAIAHYNIANAYIRLKNYNKAIKHYSLALNIRPNYVEAHNNLGMVLEITGRINEAVNHYSTALRLNPNYAPARGNLDRALKKQK